MVWVVEDLHHKEKEKGCKRVFRAFWSINKFWLGQTDSAGSIELIQAGIVRVEGWEKWTKLLVLRV